MLIIKFCNFYNKNRNVIAKNKSYCIGNRKSVNMQLWEAIGETEDVNVMAKILNGHIQEAS